MSQNIPDERAQAARRSRRVPKEGRLFGILRGAGLLLKIAGVVLLGIAVMGFVVALVKTGPVLADSFGHLGQQKMAGLVFFVALGTLLIFPLLGLIGLVAAGLGLALGHLGTENIDTGSMAEQDRA